MVTRKKAAKKKATKTKKKTSKKLNTRKKKVVKKTAASKKKTTKRKTTKKKTTKKKTTKKKTTKKKTTKKKTTKKGIKKKKMGKVTKIKTEKTETKKFTPYKTKRGEEYMGAEQAAHFRTILLNWKKVLMKEVDRTVHHMQDDAANFPDPNDRATQEEEFALELRTRDRERKLIKKINEAIVSVDNSDYGYCEICGIEIGIRRLEARPTATLCIDCKTLDEIKEKHLG
jgi:DnaK suppressor protein